MCHPKRKSAFYVQLCVIINDDREGGREGGPDFTGQSCVQRAGLMDLLRWRHVDMPRARVQVRVRVLRPSRTPMAISCSLFYGSLVLKLQVPADGRSAGVASCKWKGCQLDDGAGVKGVLAGARGQRAEANGNYNTLLVHFCQLPQGSCH